MSTITFSLNKKNARELVRHVFIGNWILNSTKIERDEELDAFYESILSMAKNYNVMEDADDIEYSEKINEYTLSEDKMNEFMDDIDEHTDEVFWDDLCEKLAFRDAIEKYGKDELESLEHFECKKKIWAEEEKYAKEFEARGVERLRIVK